MRAHYNFFFPFTISSWIQIACPRLSVDWGSSFHLPILSAFEAEQAFGSSLKVDPVVQYPMDNWAQDTHTPWSTPAHRC